LGPGVHQGFLKLTGEDALPVDDVEWFSVEVRPSWKILIAAPQDPGRKPADYAFFLSLALLKSAFDREVVSLEQLATRPLEPYAAVCLVDPRPLPPAVWQKLHSYAAAGGGVGIFLGRNATPIEAFNVPLAQEMLPAPLVRQWRGDATLAPEGFAHPLLAKFRSLEVAWELLPVFKHWQLGQLAQGASVVLSYSDGQPAIVERPVGKGRVLTTTTPLSDPSNERGYWNLIPTGEDKAVFVTLANETLFYLVGSGQQRLDYTAGERVVLHLDGEKRFPVYALSTPRGDTIRTPLDEKQQSIVVTSSDVPGNYRLQAGGEGPGPAAGFSVNLPADVTRLERVGRDELKATFGDVEFRLARGRDEIDRSVAAGRVGHELFPYLMVLVVIVLACEQVLSNRFYQDHDTSIQRTAAQKFAERSGTPRQTAAPAPLETR
jgi:hypothetical protein